MKAFIIHTDLAFDTGFVSELGTYLDEAGIDLLMASSPLSVTSAAGAEWRRAIDGYLTNVDVVLVVVSRASVQSESMLSDVARARVAGKTIVPLLLEDIALPSSLADFQVVDFRTAPAGAGRSSTELSRTWRSGTSPSPNRQPTAPPPGRTICPPPFATAS